MNRYIDINRIKQKAEIVVEFYRLMEIGKSVKEIIIILKQQFNKSRTTIYRYLKEAKIE